MPVGSAIAAVMPTMSLRSSASATSSSAKTEVHLSDGGARSLPVSGSKLPGPCRQSASSSSAGR